MPRKSNSKRASQRSVDEEVAAVVALLKRRGSKRNREGMARYAIPSDKAFGVPMRKMQDIAKRLGHSHELAAALWEAGWYETKILAAFVDEPERVTPAQMNRWCKDFNSWADCDTVCFHLFDRTPYAYRKVEQWARRRDEFVKRAAFALLACLALHDKQAEDETFLRYFPLIEAASADDRNFVKKGVSWALRLIGRRNTALNEAAVKLARQLTESPHQSARWIGRDAFRELTGATVKRHLAKRTR